MRETRKHLDSAYLFRAVILNFVESFISCRNYFHQIAKFGEDIFSYTCKPQASYYE